MLIRALIVVLFVLNLGVGLWWATRPPPQDTASATAPFGVARLQLVGEAGVAEASSLSGIVAAKPDARPAAPASPAALIQCVSFGPFANASAAAAARQRLAPRAQRITTREAFAGPARGWSVSLPPHASLAAVEATAQRVAAAGFGDYFIVRDGPEANSLALGRYSGEASARRRVTALVAAGFPAQAEPIGVGPVSYWLDVAAADGFDLADAQALAAAPERHPLDCVALR